MSYADWIINAFWSAAALILIEEIELWAEELKKKNRHGVSGKLPNSLHEHVKLPHVY